MAMEPPKRPADRFRVPSFRIDTSVEDGVGVVAVIGDLDIVTARQFARAASAVPAPVVIDLCECGFVDSTGLAVVLEAYERTGGRVAVACRPEGSPARLLEISLQQQVPVLPSRAVAVGALRGA